MRATRTPAILATLGLLLCCSPEPSQEETPPPSGAPQIYRVVPTLCHEKCWYLTLYRNDTFIELRAQQPGDGSLSLLGLATGSLLEPANEELDQLLDEAANLGELPGDVPHDSPLVELYLPGLTLIYAVNYPPSGLVELDAFLAKVLDDMSQCRPTAQITPDHDCEPLSWFPE
jgi:hypothetical protein